MSPGSVIVTGANRGIGLGLIQQFLKNLEIKHVIATARDVRKAEALHALKDPRFHVLPLDVTSDPSIDNFVSEFSTIVGENGLNLLANNAGVLLKYSTKSAPNRKLLTEQMDTDTVSVVVLTQKLLPLLLEAARNPANSSENFSVSRAAVITITSLAASISANDWGSGAFESLAYRLSKTAVNQFTKTLSIDLKDHHILAVNLNPGWTKTDMGTESARLTIEESTCAMVDSFKQLNESHNGGYFDKDLKAIPF